MTKRLLLLNGLAALMVVINHAASYGLNAMFFWTDRYRDVTVPNFDQYGSIFYYVLFIAHEIAEFAIPAFLFVSGYFVAFAARTSKTGISWEFVTTRIKKLLIPFVIWVTILIILLQRFPPTLQEVLTVYYYIPLIIQYYLLSPILVPLAKNHWKLLLIVTAIIQLGLGFLRLPALLGFDWPGLGLLIRLTPIWFFPGRIFYFSIGLVAGMHIQTFGQWINRAKWGLLLTAIIVFIITIIEYEYLVHLLDRYWLIPVYAGALKPIYAVSMVLSILAFSEVRYPFANKITDIGAKSLGIYFINTPVLYVVGSLLYYFAPAVLGMPVLYQVILLTFGYAVPLIMMSITMRTPARRVYHYIFG
jgi:peptidoglycan/LPS O-acetylase OafA/YrhL